MYFLVFVSFAQFAYLIFGTHISDYSSMTKCMYSQLRMVLGDFDFPAIRAAHPILGPGYFFVFIFMVLFILMVSTLYFFCFGSNKLGFIINDVSNFAGRNALPHLIDIIVQISGLLSKFKVYYYSRVNNP